MATNGKQLSEHVAYRNVDGIGIWIIDDLAHVVETGELAESEDHFMRTVRDREMRGVVVEVNNEGALPPEVLEHVNEKWTELGEVTPVEGTAYVADGLERLAVANENEAEGMEVKAFTNREDAVEWAKEF